MNPFMLDQAALYSAYHRDGRNIATHVIGVPAIVVALLMMLNRIELPFVLEGLTLAWIVFMIAATFYLWMHVLAGFLVDALLLAATWGTQILAQTLAPAPFWILVGVLFVGGWALQLIGHALEGRRPALTNNLLQILVAPLFLILEALFALGVAADARRAIAERVSHYPRNRGAAA